MKYLIVTVALAIGLPAASTAWGQTENTLLTFTGTNGSGPYTGLIKDSRGRFYGATVNGGANGAGAVFRLTMSAKGKWNEKVLYSFGQAASDGAYPQMAYLVNDRRGNLYGTATGGGANGEGIVFKLAPGALTWKETILYSFTGGNDGGQPIGGVTLDAKGNVYGTTNVGGGSANCGSGCGVVFELIRGKKGTWTEAVLHAFTGIPSGYQCNVAYDGANPYRTTLALDSAGNIFGTTSQGGEGCGSFGTDWELSPGGGGSWTYTQLHVPGGSDYGQYPDAGMVLDGQGNLYGTAAGGGIFELVKSQGYLEQILYQGNANDQGDYDTVTFDNSGDLIWTSQSGYESDGDKGAVHELSPDGLGGWNYSALYKFPGNGSAGTQPFAGVMLDASGNIYGTCTVGGGSQGNEDGTVWQVTP